MAIVPNEHPLIRDIADFLAFERNDAIILSEVAALTCPVEIVREDEGVLLRDWTPATQMRWHVLVCGYWHGGSTGNYAEALAHAYRCSKWTPEEMREWVATHRALGVREEVR